LSEQGRSGGQYQVNRQHEFWHWFSEHQGELFEFETDRERIFDEVAAQLRKVDPDLTFEFGPEGPTREFVISAGGLKHAFPAVVSLANAAPQLDRWKVIAFRPRRPLHSAVEFRGRRVSPDDVYFSLLASGSTPGIYLFIPGFQDEDADLTQIGYLLLDVTLGEYDVEARLGLIKMLSPDARTEGKRYSLAELPVRFDELVDRLAGRSGKPS
jgi:hypothetical protein